MENATQIKERLHRKIERVEDAALLKRIEDIYFSDEESEALTDEQQKIIDTDTRPYMSEDEVMNMLHDREELYKAGKLKVIPSEEVEAELKRRYGF